MVNSDDKDLCFKFGNFTITFFHLLGYTKDLAFGSSTSVTRFNLFFVCFINVSRFFKEPSGIVRHTFEVFRGGWILLE